MDNQYRLADDDLKVFMNKMEIYPATQVAALDKYIKEQTGAKQVTIPVEGGCTKGYALLIMHSQKDVQQILQDSNCSFNGIIPNIRQYSRDPQSQKRPTQSPKRNSNRKDRKSQDNLSQEEPSTPETPSTPRKKQTLTQPQRKDKPKETNTEDPTLKTMRQEIKESFEAVSNTLKSQYAFTERIDQLEKQRHQEIAQLKHVIKSLESRIRYLEEDHHQAKQMFTEPSSPSINQAFTVQQKGRNTTAFWKG